MFRVCVSPPPSSIPGVRGCPEAPEQLPGLGREGGGREGRKEGEGGLEEEHFKTPQTKVARLEKAPPGCETRGRRGELPGREHPGLGGSPDDVFK